MADIVTGTTTGQVDLSDLHLDHAAIRSDVNQGHAEIRAEGFSQAADIRHDVLQGMADGRYAGALHAGDIRREIADSACNINSNVKEGTWKTIDRIENAADRAGDGFDRVTNQDTQYFIAGQQHDFENATALAALKASMDMAFARTQADIQLSGEKTAAAAALASEKVAAAVALGQANMERRLHDDGDTTRALINDLKMQELNRKLSERHTEIVEEKSNAHWNVLQSNINAMQYQLTQQINTLNSQMNETRQGLVNFGYMSGGAGQQTSTSNNVR